MSTAFRNRASVTSRAPRACRHAAAVALSACCALSSTPAFAQTSGPDVAQMSIEDLMKVDVTTVSRRAQRLQDAAAAVSVLTSEDIRRSGATSIPEALRLVPGVHVARIDANKWSVSVRGFTGRYANKLLVLVDGRSVYTPLWSGVVWDLVNIPLNTIERIEVIRGPGATLWGANAVNGVINIITRSAGAYQGIHLTAATGSADRGMFSLSGGRPLSAATALRVDASGSVIDGSTLPFTVPVSADDNWRNWRLGARVDSKRANGSEVSVQTAYAHSHINDAWLFPTLTPPFAQVTAGEIEHTSAFGSGEWRRPDASGETILRGSLEYSNISEVFARDERKTVNIEAQRTQRIGQRHTLVLGATERYSADQLVGSTWTVFATDARTLVWHSVFAQDDIAFAGNRFRLTGGLKMEHNDYTGWEPQPNVRGIFAVNERQSFWGAVSRAVRLPSRGEADGQLWLMTLLRPDVPLPIAIRLQGLGTKAESEKMTGYEGGYRLQFGNVASLDVSIFDQRYSGLRVVSGPSTFVFDPVPVPHLVAPIPLAFDLSQYRRGFEVAAEWRPQARLRLNGGATWLNGYTSVPPTTDGLPSTDEPKSYGFARAAVNLPARVELDGALRYASAMPATGIPGYVTADARVGFRLSSINLAVVGRNLLASEHKEFIGEFFSLGRCAAERSILVQATFSR